MQGNLIGIIGCTILAFMILFAILSHVGITGTVCSLKEREKAILYKAETENCRDEFGLLNKEFIDEVQEWNETVSSHQ